MTINLDSPAAVDRFIHGQEAAAVYFSGAGCGVCQVLLPKVKALFAERFARVAVGLVDCGRVPEAAAQRQVFSVPTLVVYFQGQEVLRKSRSFGLGELAGELERPYRLFFGG